MLVFVHRVLNEGGKHTGGGRPTRLVADVHLCVSDARNAECWSHIGSVGLVVGKDDPKPLCHRRFEQHISLGE